MSKLLDYDASTPSAIPGQLGLELFSKLSNDATDKNAQKKGSKKDKQPMRPAVVKRWEKITSQLRIHSWGELMSKFNKQKQVHKRWKSLLQALMKQNPSIGFNRKFISKLVQ